MSASWEPFGSASRSDAPPPSSLARAPQRSLAVLTCMDARIDPLAAFGLRIGDAHVLRNAGAEASDDVIRSLRISHAAAGTREVWLVGHSDCLAHDSSDERVEASLRRSLERVAGLHEGFRVRAFRYDLGSGQLQELRFAGDEVSRI